jgi:outer membrane protein assembly factor BamB
MGRKVTRAALVAAICLCISSSDWPEFRGPTGQGLVSTGSLPVEWTPTKNIAWKQAIPGIGWSSPVVASDRIYLTTGVKSGDRLSLRTLCLNARNGNILWDREVFRPAGASVKRHHAKNSPSSPTPIVHGQRLFVHFGHNGTACLDLDGNIVWRNSDLSYQPVHGNGGSPVLVDNALAFSCDGSDTQFVAALDRETGRLLWKTGRSVKAERPFSFCTPLVIEVGGQKQIVSPGSNMVGAYDPQSGREIWRVRYDGYSVVPRPVYAHGLVFVCSGYDSPVMLAIRPDGTGDVTDSHVAWKATRGVPATPSPLVIADDLYMVADNGIVSCLDAKTGGLHWRERLGGKFSASPIAADGKIYFQSEEGIGTVIQAGKKLEVIARNAMNERVLASYAATNRALFIRTEKHLYRVQTVE